MSDNLVLEHLRYIRAATDGLRDDVRDLKQRANAADLVMASMRRDDIALSEQIAHLSVKIDRNSDRLERIERRLDIVPA